MVVLEALILLISIDVQLWLALGCHLSAAAVALLVADNSFWVLSINKSY